jgi:hypothetical protein
MKHQKPEARDQKSEINLARDASGLLLCAAMWIGLLAGVAAVVSCSGCATGTGPTLPKPIPVELGK